MSAEELREAVAGAAPPEAQTTEPGPNAAPDWRAEVARLAALPPIEADREMEGTAAALGCLLSTLREEVKRAKGEVAGSGALGTGQPLDLADRKPWPERVNGAVVLDELGAELAKYVVMSAEARTATALWIAHTYVLDRADHAPRLRVKSPEKRCGKSTLLDFLLETCCRPLPLNNTTPAALFRTVELARPTLLIDEADSFMRDNDELRGLVNSGHRRTLAFIIRTVEIEGEYEPRRFSTWCAMAIAGIGALHGTVEDRSIIVELRRKLPNEQVARLDRAARKTLDELGQRIARWAADHGPRLEEAEPKMPAGLNDRAVDNWRPLLAIADAAGGQWPEKARKSATVLAGADLEDSLATELLADVRALFEDADRDRGEIVGELSSTHIVAELMKLEHRPWPEMPKTGKPLTARKLAVLLGRFGIAPEHTRDGNVYHRAHFADAFVRYLSSPDPATEPSQPSQASKINDLRPAETFTCANQREGSAPAKSLAFSMPVKVVKVRRPGDNLPPWDNLDEWRPRLGAAADLEARRAVVLEWARAAGGTVNGCGFALPPDLPHGLALAELQSAAQCCGLTVEEPVLQPFVPARDRQEVPQGAVLPPGLDIRMNLAGGPKRARLKPDEPEGFDL